MTRAIKNRSRLQRIFLYVAAFFVGLFLLLLVFKGPLLSAFLQHKISDYNSSHPLRIELGESRLSGFSHLRLDDISISLPQEDTLLYIVSVELDLRPEKIFSRNQLLKTLRLESGFLSYQRTGEKKDSLPEEVQETSESGNSLADRIIDMAQRYFPSSIAVRDFQIRYQDSLGTLGLEVSEINGSAESLAGNIALSDDQSRQAWQIQGQLGDQIRVEASPLSNDPMPGIYQRLHLDLRVDTLEFALENKGKEKGFHHLEIRGRMSGLQLYHPKISSDTVLLQALQADMQLQIGKGYLAVDSNSRFQLNEVVGRFGIRAPLTRKGNQYALLIESDKAEAQSFFNSLPKGAFDDAQGIKVQGQLQYRLEFSLDGNHPDDVIFDSRLDRYGFKILSFGHTNLALMNGSFSHTVYENEKPFRTFEIGPENPNCTPLSAVPQNLIHAILVSEDPSFFQHRGFIQEAFRESIAVNYQTHSFKRGGSTISMQLVKNVFLNRKKTVFRKIEEALLVWLIETQHLTPKERMMEVYVNLIEWGPGIYGIGEASKFYFNKTPQELSLPECIYLANIIPKPKKFKYSFTSDGQLKDYMQDLQVFILKRMVLKEMLPPSDTLNYNSAIYLSGPARNLVVESDTISMDTSVQEEPLLFEIVPE